MWLSNELLGVLDSWEKRLSLFHRRTLDDTVNQAWWHWLSSHHTELLRVFLLKPVQCEEGLRKAGPRTQWSVFQRWTEIIQKLQREGTHLMPLRWLHSSGPLDTIKEIHGLYSSESWVPRPAPSPWNFGQRFQTSFFVFF